ncbi:hypothetical protein H6F92_03565 [Microcystis wesenbergii FACHB-1317]|nr:hypothetical protein [Microcystis wesenbergii FACHB-1317]
MGLSLHKDSLGAVTCTKLLQLTENPVQRVYLTCEQSSLPSPSGMSLMGFGSAWILIEKWKWSIPLMTVDKLDGKYGKEIILVGQKGLYYWSYWL